MSVIKASIAVSDVTCINRVGTGPVYRAIVPIEHLHGLLESSTVRYAPRYQRGFKKQSGDIPESKYNQLLPLTHSELDIRAARAQEMAVKYLKAAAGDRGTMLFSSHVTWNARKEPGKKEPEYLEAEKTLKIHTTITVPDTGHRHMGYYLIVHWKIHPAEIPPVVVVNDVPVTKAEIEALVNKIDLSIHNTHSVYVDIYCLPAEQEGWLYDEFNADAKPPARAVALDLNAQKTPSRRFVSSLMDTCDMFSRNEVEFRSNTIASKSRKLTTNSTLESAVKPFLKDLIKAEQQGTGRHQDLVAFCCSFFREYGRHYKAALPGASGDDRQKLRELSFAIANIMFFPLFRIAFEFWREFEAKKLDWRTQRSWKTALAKIGGASVSNDAGKRASQVNVMSRENPAWRGKILVEQYDPVGRKTGYALSSTRQTREAAYAYLRGIAGRVAPAATEDEEAA